jgi:cobalt-precorrin 5A hydrolase
MDLDQTLMVAGIGCRSGVSADQVEAAISAAIDALEAAEAVRQPVSLMPSEWRHRTLTAIATPAAKAHELGIKAAAAARGIPLMLISQEALEAANPATLTRSEHSMAAMNVHSVAEAAALAGAAALARQATANVAAANTATPAAAPAGNATASADTGFPAAPCLLAPRITLGPVTCALADIPK